MNSALDTPACTRAHRHRSNARTATCSKQHGFGEEQVVDIVLITYTFNIMERLADELGVELDPQM
jgi:hypothetical protein